MKSRMHKLLGLLLALVMLAGLLPTTALAADKIKDASVMLDVPVVGMSPDYTPEFPWETQPASDKQIKLIENAGINTDGMCKGQASKIIDVILNRRRQGLATAKQMRMLEQKGFQNVGLWTFEQASYVMGVLAQNRWRVPWGMNPATYVPT